MEYGAQFKDFSYCLTKDIDLLLVLRISSLEGAKEKRPPHEGPVDPSLLLSELNLSLPSQRSDLYVTCQIFADNKPLTVAVRTPYKQFKNRWVWNEWITVPIKYKDLPANAQLTFTVWDIASPRKTIPIGGTTLPLFTKNNAMRKGRQKLYLWPEVEADGGIYTTTPGKIAERDEMDRLEKLVKKHECGDLPRLDWLDNLAFREIEKIHNKETAKSTKMFLYIDLPKFDFPLIYSEQEYPLPNTPLHEPSLVVIADPEMSSENPVEAKHRRLVRSHRNGPLDRDLKPNAKIRDDLNIILKYPPTQALTTEEKDLLWKFRFYLTRDKKALTKFLKCVVWTDATEVKQAVDLLPTWADIDVDDALELLGPGFENHSVRGYAVNQLKKAEDDDLLLYLLQLVQALKFEGIDTRRNSGQTSSLTEFLIERSIRNPVLGNNFHWYLMVECEDKTLGKMYGKVAFQYMSAMMEISSGHVRRDILRRQGELMKNILSIAKELRDLKETRLKKIERLRAIINDPKNGLNTFLPLPLPLDAKVQVTGIIAEKSTIFKSSLMPLKLTFQCVDGTEYPVMFKTGDDLRQDQLVIQIITLMDKLLRKENLDLKLTPYKVLATGSDHGLIQHIPSKSLAAVLAEHNNSLLSFLREHNPDNRASSYYGVSPAVMDAYIKSCAGYCVITYLLGVGDRHLDNLLLSPNGRLFHIDFGFILGRDPKPFPPPMKLCKEMVEAMGGQSSPHYQRFKSYCYSAFTILRKSANLILNLFALMVSANITDIAIEPDKAVTKVQEKFRLDLTEEEAIQYFQNLINDSVSALFPQLMETVHKWAQYWRK
ncbi:phosphatidylinositol 3-kinase [Basidiobolus meristosporus CBS 931.73]|uniref:Phosphatidylinositol 3-kinase VPS34 n=1 Tax=Basidiobolus meristosporus CBS 931.73 TaxID=1314790 RepID=A0A1Y1Y2L3_9FUNG|nr:phosphatidylinositol 3-kinase [Basidiobolus meristosporus CBS 931.73]|eukprot:ORX92228.1 phosphatidylinositol 3-kinase [Basidiobolus meristosporus CBS 931.73]